MHHKWVAAHLLIHGGALTVAGVDHRIGRQGIDTVLDRKMSAGHDPPGRSQRPTPRWNSVSPESRSDPILKAHRPAVCPGVCNLDVEAMPAEQFAVAEVLFAHHIGQVVRNAWKVPNRVELFAIIGWIAASHPNAAFTAGTPLTWSGWP